MRNSLPKALFVVVAAGLAAVLSHPVQAQSARDPADVRAQADALRTELDEATRAYIEARDALSEVEAQLRQAQRELDASAEQVGEARELLSQHAVSAYQSGGALSPLSVLLTHDTEQAVERIELATIVASRQQQQIEDARAVAAAYDEAIERFAAARERHQALVSQQEAAVQAINERLAAAEELYQRLEAEERARAAQAAAAAATQVAADGGSQGAAVGESGGGDADGGGGGGGGGASAQVTGDVACPVEGPRSYIDSWGAARSGGRSHKGTDIMAAHGKTVYAYANGEITRTSVNSGLGGTTVYLQGDDGTVYYYAHLDSFSVSPGERVTVGQPIGANGSTGNASASAPHVHFEVHVAGTAVNPYPYVRRACG